MRLHRLEAVAFGPFAERVEVDFDALSDSGLFLLTGATGSGKTSVLDAVCFALYGAVPGDRQGAKRLRSDHAAPDVAPSVSLELSVAGRRFRVVRSPAWERPRRRGGGTTREQAHVLLTERVDGAWTTRATRLDEAGHLVSDLLGLTLSQFCQVQLLPQGRFQAFLRADSDDRHRLLQRLFRTARFEDVEQWLRERRRALRRDAGRAHDVVGGLLGRVSEAAGEPLPAAWDPHDLVPVSGALAPWARAHAGRATSARERAAARVGDLVAAEAAALRARDEGRGLAERQERHARALEREQALGVSRAGHRGRVEALAAARAAAAVVPAWEEVARARDAVSLADREAEDALADARARLGHADPGPEELPAAAEEAAAGAVRARALQPHLEELAGIEVEARQVAAEADEATARLARLDERAAALPEELAEAREAEATAVRADDQVELARHAVTAAAERRQAARTVVDLTDRLAEAEALHHASVDTAQALREDWLGVQQRRLEGMAAEIAGALAVGHSCPVCGSADHPHPARPGPDAPDLAAERSARRDVDDAESERHARSLAVHDLRTRRDVATERSGGRSPADLDAEHAAAIGALEQIERRAAELPRARTTRERLDAEHAGLVAARSAQVTESATLDHRRQVLRARAERLTADLDAVLAGTGHDSVTSLAAHLDGVAGACRAAHEAVDEHARAVRSHEQARRRAAALGSRHGFADESAVRAVSLPGLLLEQVEREIHAHEVASAAVAEALADSELRAAAEAPEPDLEALVEDHRLRQEELAEARATAAVAERRATRLERLRTELDVALAAWEPLRADLAVAERLAALADGSSVDNRLRMRLSAYVLAARLGQVVDAANERLARMFDHRYALEHTGARGVGETRGGLSLRVRDDWTGETRDPATLSGGETFVVSLALALGLADVIAHEAGGAGLDTLFVDEGFGSLDAETLDQVLDTLDSLRDGGRVVGVVSHVAEMQTRIPTRLHVRKRRIGSTLHQTR